MDDLTKNLGAPSVLINYHLATIVDLSYLNLKGLNNAVHLPIMIGFREGTRNSSYTLKPGQTAMVGMYITNSGILLRFWERETGKAEFCEIGDVYKYSLKSIDGTLYYEGRGKVEEFDKEKGAGKIGLKQTETSQVSQKVKEVHEYSILWSCISGTKTTYE